MANTYFISDIHFGHELMLKLYPKFRPFSNVKQMDEYLIEFWNKTVRPQDSVYNLGDISFHGVLESRKILKKLNGRHHIVLGNHDKHIRDGKLDDMFESISEYKFLRPKKANTTLALFHYPIYEWANFHRGGIHLYGHIHGRKAPLDGKALNICYDFNGRFLELSEVISLTRGLENQSRYESL